MAWWYKHGQKMRREEALKEGKEFPFLGKDLVLEGTLREDRNVIWQKMRK